MKTVFVLPLLAAGLAIVAAAASGSAAGGEGRIAPVGDATVAQECSACHMAFPPALLPKRSWTAIMQNLGDHFGENAELDPDATRRIADYLTANAADGGGANSRVLRGLPAAAAPLRITELPWWRQKHDRKGRVAPATLKRRGAKLESDCVACHADAARGYFDDD
jgi:hypothetical protein